MRVWLIVPDGLVKGLDGWASGFERLAEGSTVDADGGKVEVWAGVCEVVVWADRKVGSISRRRVCAFKRSGRAGERDAMECAKV